MSTTRLWSGSLAYLLPTFPLGYFWHLTWFQREYKSLDLYRSDVIIPFGLASMIIQALIFSWSYQKLFSTRRADWMRSALLSFFTFGFLAWSFTTLPIAAKYDMTSVAGFMWLESGFTFLQFAVVSPLLAFVSREREFPALA
jgi:hypothetical protein